jgi:DNA-binding response OmpR family regulator
MPCLPERAHWILVIEDDTEIRESLCDVLESEGYRVVDARHGREGLDRLAVLPEPCLILLDLMMPVMSGREFLQHLRKDREHSGVPVVVLSAWPGEASVVRDLSQGFLPKPLSIQVLLHTVHLHCSR